MRHRAWFWHSKGFLCNGDEFVEWDGVPGYAERERITVTYDSNQGMLRFASGDHPTYQSTNALSLYISFRDALHV